MIGAGVSMKRAVLCYSKNKIMIVLTVCACMWLSIPLCACKEKPYTFTDPIEYIDGVPICEWEMGYFQHRVVDGYYDLLRRPSTVRRHILRRTDLA